MLASFVSAALVANAFVSPLPTVSRRTMTAQDMFKKPEKSKIIKTIKDVHSLQSCLAKCPKHDDCQSVMHAMTSSSCRLYNTSEGTAPLQEQEQAVKIIASSPPITTCKLFQIVHYFDYLHLNISLLTMVQ